MYGIHKRERKQLKIEKKLQNDKNYDKGEEEINNNNKSDSANSIHISLNNPPLGIINNAFMTDKSDTTATTDTGNDKAINDSLYEVIKL